MKVLGRGLLGVAGLIWGLGRHLIPGYGLEPWGFGAMLLGHE